MAGDESEKEIGKDDRNESGESEEREVQNEQKESIDVGIFHVPRHFVFNALQFMYFVHFFHLVNGITLSIKFF